MIEQGKVRAARGDQRPTARGIAGRSDHDGSGYPQVGFDPDVWQAFVAPAGTPDAVIRKLNAAVKESLQAPEVKAAFAKLNFKPLIKTPEEFAAFLEAQGAEMAAGHQGRKHQAAVALAFTSPRSLP